MGNRKREWCSMGSGRVLGGAVLLLGMLAAGCGGGDPDGGGGGGGLKLMDPNGGPGETSPNLNPNDSPLPLAKKRQENCGAGIKSVAQGSLNGVAVDQGFCGIDVSFTDTAIDGAFGDDGYVYAAPAATDGKLAGGLVRMPSAVPTEPGAWYCIERGSIEQHEGVVRVKLDSVSKLGSKAQAQPGANELQKSALYWDRSALGIIADSWTGTSVGNRMELDRLDVFSPLGDFVDDSWRLLGFRPKADGDFNGTATDLMLVGYGTGTGALQVAFPGAESSYTAKDGFVDVDLRAVSQPVSCPGQKVAGNLTISLDISW
jgi:hypothetical protein